MPRIIHSPNLTDAIIDDSNARVLPASLTNTIHADSCLKPPFPRDGYGQFTTGPALLISGPASSAI